MHKQHDADSVTDDPASATPAAVAQPWPGVFQGGEAQPAVTASAAQGSGRQQHQMHPPASNASGAEMHSEKLIPFSHLPLLPRLTPSVQSDALVAMLLLHLRCMLCVAGTSAVL